MFRKLLAAALAGCGTLAFVGAAPAQPLVLAQDTSFFVGGTYVKTADGTVMDGQMYVHAMVPWKVTHRYPIVFITGINLTGTNFETTADGREGWAQFFVRHGYAVYVTDQPARGRSEHHPDLDGPVVGGRFSTAEVMERFFTAPEKHENPPQAKLHTQWPGTGVPGDPAFDQAYAAQVDSIPTKTGWSELHTKSAAAALLDRIGPAILLTHSQGGAFGWQVADARPGKVKAIVAVEPGLSPTEPASGSAPATYGVTGMPITFAPPIADPQQLGHVPQAAADAPDVERCWLQAEPAHRLPNLAGIPIAIVVSEASPLNRIHYCVSKFLAQAGVPNDYVRLQNVGIHGNSHIMMLEKNSDEIAAYFDRWLGAKGL